MYTVKMDGNASINGTSLQGEIDISYAELVQIFGKPNSSGDDYKVDAEWLGEINGRVFTIYNYKTGKNYLGNEGEETHKIRDWHIGGAYKDVGVMVSEYIASAKAHLPKKYQNDDVIESLEKITGELDYRLNEGLCFSKKEVKRIKELTKDINKILGSLLPLQIRDI